MVGGVESVIGGCAGTGAATLTGAGACAVGEGRGTPAGETEVAVGVEEVVAGEGGVGGRGEGGAGAASSSAAVWPAGMVAAAAARARRLAARLFAFFVAALDGASPTTRGLAASMTEACLAASWLHRRWFSSAKRGQGEGACQQGCLSGQRMQCSKAMGQSGTHGWSF